MKLQAGIMARYSQIQTLPNFNPPHLDSITLEQTRTVPLHAKFGLGLLHDITAKMLIADDYFDTQKDRLPDGSVPRYCDVQQGVLDVVDAACFTGGETMSKKIGFRVDEFRDP